MPVTINGDGSITGLSVGGLGSGVVNTATLANGAAVGSKLGTGAVLQVKQTVKTDTTSYSNAGSFADIAGMSVTITPSSSSSNILVFPDLGLASNDMTNYHCIWRILRGSTAIAESTTATSAQLKGTGGMHRGANGANAYFLGHSKMFIDSPNTTSATTYKCQWSAFDNNATLYLNRRGSNLSVGSISTITVMEIKV